MPGNRQHKILLLIEIWDDLAGLHKDSKLRWLLKPTYRSEITDHLHSRAAETTVKFEIGKISSQIKSRDFNLQVG